jgi:hypothetical protein
VTLFLIFVATAFAQSGAPTGTHINPSVPNGVESNPVTFENVQPVLGTTPAPAATAAPRSKSKRRSHGLKGGNSQVQKQTFVSPPDSMEKEAVQGSKH